MTVRGMTGINVCCKLVFSRLVSSHRDLTGSVQSTGLCGAEGRGHASEPQLSVL